MIQKVKRQTELTVKYNKTPTSICWKKVIVNPKLHQHPYMMTSYTESFVLGISIAANRICSKKYQEGLSQGG